MREIPLRTMSGLQAQQADALEERERQEAAASAGLPDDGSAA
jgi:hypothetical protein